MFFWGLQSGGLCRKGLANGKGSVAHLLVPPNSIRKREKILKLNSTTFPTKMLLFEERLGDIKKHNQPII